jgi:hypothetical protein
MSLEFFRLVDASTESSTVVDSELALEWAGPAPPEAKLTHFMWLKVNSCYGAHPLTLEAARALSRELARRVADEDVRRAQERRGLLMEDL